MNCKQNKYATNVDIGIPNNRFYGGGMQIARFNSYALLFLKVEKDKYTKLYIFRKPTISGIHYMKMKSSDLLKLMILIFAFILNVPLFFITPNFFIRREAI